MSKLIDYIIEAYNDENIELGSTLKFNDNIKKGDNVSIFSNSRVKTLSPDNMNVSYFWAQAVKNFPAFSIAGQINDFKVEDINKLTLFGTHLKSSIVKNFIVFCKINVEKINNFKLLEIGPGFGGMKDFFNKEVPNLKWYGVDVNCLFKHPRLYKGDGKTLPKKLPKMNIVYSINVFQHLSKAQRTSYYNEIYNNLFNGGVFIFGMFILTDENENIQGDYGNLFGAKDESGRYYTTFLSQLTEIDHIDETYTELQEIGFKIKSFEMIGLNYGVFMCFKD